MSPFETGTHFPRSDGNMSHRSLLDFHGGGIEKLTELPIDLRHASFHSAGHRRVTEAELVSWRASLNDWAYDRGFPSKLNTSQRSTWDVELGSRLHEDTKHLPEALHPAVWCWIATHLLPHFVVYRWGWPKRTDGRGPWARFGSDLRNGLRLAVHRIVIYGPELVRRATEQEFQSIQYRPAFGLDPRVAKQILWTLVDSYADPNSKYGKYGGTRALDCNEICVELRVINSLRPFSFISDEGIQEITREVIDRLPELRMRKTYGQDLPKGTWSLLDDD